MLRNLSGRLILVQKSQGLEMGENIIVEPSPTVKVIGTDTDRSAIYDFLHCFIPDSKLTFSKVIRSYCASNHTVVKVVLCDEARLEQTPYPFQPH